MLLNNVFILPSLYKKSILIYYVYITIMYDLQLMKIYFIKCCWFPLVDSLTDCSSLFSIEDFFHLNSLQGTENVLWSAPGSRVDVAKLTTELIFIFLIHIVSLLSCKRIILFLLTSAASFSDFSFHSHIPNMYFHLFWGL